MKQTAVDWLIDKLDNNLDINHSWRSRQYIEHAKEMEKEQIKEAYKIVDLDIQHEDVGEINSEQYYKETYEQ